MEPCKIRLGRIHYINVDPIYYVFDQGHGPGWVEIVEAAPSVLNQMLLEGYLDVSPVSSIAYARHFAHWSLLPELSISSHGRVMSVILASRVPLKELQGKLILLSRESETSVALLRLCLEREGICAHLVREKLDSKEGLAKTADAALVIGDTALQWGRNGLFPHTLDLGQYWSAWTARPFVYALWAVSDEALRKNPSGIAALVKVLKNSLKQGMDRMDFIAQHAGHKLGLPHGLMRRYFQGLSYDLGYKEQTGMLLFFERLYEKGLLEKAVPLKFVACSE